MLSYLTPFLKKDDSPSPSVSSNSKLKSQSGSPPLSICRNQRGDDVIGKENDMRNDESNLISPPCPSSPTPALSAADTPSPEPFVLVREREKFRSLEDSAVALLKQVTSAAAHTSTADHLQQDTPVESSTATTKLLPDFAQETADNGDDGISAQFFDADQVSVLGNHGAEDGEESSLTGFVSCKSRSSSGQRPPVQIIRFNDIDVSPSCHPPIDALQQELLESYSQSDNISVLSSTSFHTAASFQTAASHFSRQSLRTNHRCTSADSYATALSQMSTKTDKVFVVMPQRLIRSGHVEEGISVLGDSRYIMQRIQKLGATLAAQLMAADCDYLEQRTLVAAATGTNADSSTGGGWAGSPHLTGLSTQSAAAARLLMLYDKFRRQVVNSCFESGTTSLDNDNIGNTDNDSVSSIATTSTEGGRALYMLGTALDRRGLSAKAMLYFRQALGLFFSEVRNIGKGIVGSRSVNYDAIIDNSTSDDDDAVVLDNIHIARSLVYLGDLHEKKGEVNQAIKAFQSSLPYLERAIKTYHGESKALVDQGGDESALLGSIHDVRIEVLFVLAIIGGLHRRTEAYENALTCFDNIVKKGQADFGRDHALVKLAMISAESIRKLSDATYKTNKSRTR